MRRRDPGYTSPAEFEAAMAPFNRPAAQMSWDLLDAFVVHEFCSGTLSSYSMSFVPAARAKLLGHLYPNTDPADAALAWLELELRGVFDEERGYVMRYTHPQLLAALRALARLDPASPRPVLSPAFLEAVKSNERYPERNSFLPEDLEALPYGDNLEPLVTWNDLETTELMRRADALFLAVRQRRPDNWEKLARRSQWEPLRQGTIDLCARMWIEVLECQVAASKPLLAFTLELLALVDPRQIDMTCAQSIDQSRHARLPPSPSIPPLIPPFA
jgi:hypothetical protein